MLSRCAKNLHLNCIQRKLNREAGAGRLVSANLPFQKLMQNNLNSSNRTGSDRTGPDRGGFNLIPRESVSRKAKWKDEIGGKQNILSVRLTPPWAIWKRPFLMEFYNSLLNNGCHCDGHAKWRCIPAPSVNGYWAICGPTWRGQLASVSTYRALNALRSVYCSGQRLTLV